MNRERLKMLYERWRAYPGPYVPTALDMTELLEALLSEEPPDPRLAPQLPALTAYNTDTPPVACVRCGRTIPEGEMVQFGVDCRIGSLVTGTACWGACPVPLEAWIA